MVIIRNQFIITFLLLLFFWPFAILLRSVLASIPFVSFKLLLFFFDCLLFLTILLIISPVFFCCCCRQLPLAGLSNHFFSILLCFAACLQLGPRQCQNEIEKKSNKTLTKIDIERKKSGQERFQIFFLFFSCLPPLPSTLLPPPAASVH